LDKVWRGQGSYNSKFFFLTALKFVTIYLK